jgi:beta-lactam-binding protein with PASTA domain
VRGYGETRTTRGWDTGSLDLIRDLKETTVRDGITPQGSYHEVHPKGVLLDWSPKGPELPKGTEITLTVSKGPEPRAVPDVAGRTFEEAAKLIASRGLKATRAEAFHDAVPPGRAISTRPAAGSEVPRDSSVAVVVSKGPDVLPVPNVADRSVPEAQTILGQAGLPVANVYGPLNGRVFATNPPAGAVVRRGSGVSIYTR